MTLNTPQNTTQTRTDAIQTIQELMQRFNISPRDLNFIETDNKTSFLQKMMIQGGALLMFSGLATFIGMQWDVMNALMRILFTLGAGFGFLAIGIAALKTPRFENFVTPLLLIAAILQPIGLGVFMDEFFTGDNFWRAGQIIAGFMALQQGLLFLAKRNTIFLTFFLIFFYGLMISLLREIDIDGNVIGLVLGVSAMVLGFGLSRGPHHGLTRHLYGIGAISIAVSTFDLVDRTPADILLIGVSGALLAFSLKVKEKSLLLLSVLSFFCYLGYYTDRYFSDVVGWPIALMLVGFLMMGISVFAIRLGKRF